MSWDEDEYNKGRKKNDWVYLPEEKRDRLKDKKRKDKLKGGLIW